MAQARKAEKRPRESLWRRLRRFFARLFGASQIDVDEPRGPRSDVETSGSSLPRADAEDVARAQVVVEQQLEQDFRRNLREPLRATRLYMRSLDFFGDTRWELHPTVNVLLGRNGDGKSLVLRTLAGMLQRDVVATGDLLKGPAREYAHIELALSRGGAPEKIERDWEVFLRDSIAKVPLLAIP